VPACPPGEEQADGQGDKTQDGDDQPVGKGHDAATFWGRKYQFQPRLSKPSPCKTLIPVDFTANFRYHL
jgi:hypothetical protein